MLAAASHEGVEVVELNVEGPVSEVLAKREMYSNLTGSQTTILEIAVPEVLANEWMYSNPTGSQTAVAVAPIGAWYDKEMHVLKWSYFKSSYAVNFLVTYGGREKRFCKRSVKRGMHLYKRGMHLYLLETEDAYFGERDRVDLNPMAWWPRAFGSVRRQQWKWASPEHPLTLMLSRVLFGLRQWLLLRLTPLRCQQEQAPSDRLKVLSESVRRRDTHYNILLGSLDIFGKGGGGMNLKYEVYLTGVPCTEVKYQAPQVTMKNFPHYLKERSLKYDLSPYSLVKGVSGLQGFHSPRIGRVSRGLRPSFARPRKNDPIRQRRTKDGAIE